MPPFVKMYTLSTCSHCKATKKFMDDCAIQYEFIDVDLLEGPERTTTINDVKKLNPNISFPTIIIGDKIIIGFNEEKLREALGL
jgi:glutaredoxin